MSIAIAGGTMPQDPNFINPFELTQPAPEGWGDVIPINSLRSDARTMAWVGQMLNRARSLSPIANENMAVGDDKSRQEHSFITQPFNLEPWEETSLYLKSGIVRTVVDIYPDEAPGPEWVEGEKKYGMYGNDVMGALSAYFDNMMLGTFDENLREASREARLHGHAWLLLFVDDGQDWDQPINEDRIRSFPAVKILFHDEIEQPKLFSSTYQYVISDRRRQNNEGNDTPSDLPNFQEIHKSRLIQISGDRIPDSVRRDRNQLGHQSVVTAMFNALAKTYLALEHSNTIMGDQSLLTFGVNGLSTMRKNAANSDELAQAIYHLVMYRNLNGVIAYDKNMESLDFKNRGGLSGLYQGIEQCIAILVAETRIPRFKLLGTANSAGLGAEGRGIQDREAHDNNCIAWSNKHWRSPINIAKRLVFLAKDGPTGGRLPRGPVEFIFPSQLELEPGEHSKTFAANAQTLISLIEAKVLTPLEVREALFGKPKPPLRPYPTLDADYTEKLRKAVEVEAVQLSPPEPAPAPGQKAIAGAGAKKDDDEEPKEKAGAKKGQRSDSLRADDNRPCCARIPWRDDIVLNLQYKPFDKRFGRILPCAYGRIEKTKGLDGMAIDCYVGTNLGSDRVWVVTQVDQETHQIDELKYMIGFTDGDGALEAYKIAMGPYFDRVYGGMYESTVQDIRDQVSTHRADAKDKDVLDPAEWTAIAQGVFDSSVQLQTIETIGDAL